mgnify:CR=1 FL=1
MIISFHRVEGELTEVGWCRVARLPFSFTEVIQR